MDIQTDTHLWASCHRVGNGLAVSHKRVSSVLRANLRLVAYKNLLSFDVEKTLSYFSVGFPLPTFLLHIHEKDVRQAEACA